MDKVVAGCAASRSDAETSGPSDTRPTLSADEKEGNRMSILVGSQAPDFEASGFQNGAFGKFKLSDYRGKWVVLCFYPGDFTFV